MSAYREIPSAEVDADSPVTTTLMSALANNPKAIAEGAPGAPKIAAKVMTYSATAGGNFTFTGLAGYGGLVVHGHTYAGSSGVALTVAGSNDGSSFGSASGVYTSAGIGAGSFSFSVDLADGSYELVWSDAGAAGRETGTLAGVSEDITAIRFITVPGLSVSAMGLPNGGDSAS